MIGPLLVFVGIWIFAVVIFRRDRRPSRQLQLRIARKAALTGALLGLLVPLICLAVLHLFQQTPDAGDWLLWIWPSSLGLIALDGPAPLPILDVVFALAVLIGVNIVLYAGIAWGGAFAWALILKRTGI
jgi:hypothetical protein